MQEKNISLDVNVLDKRFEDVVEQLKANLISGKDTAAQFSLYHQGKCVIDISGSTLEKQYTPRTLTNVFSSGKTIAALLVARLVSDGVLDYEEKVATYWPEFGKNGKQGICLKDVLRHESGLAMLKPEGTVAVDLLFSENSEKLAKLIEEAAPMWEYREEVEEGERIYHAVTRGYILDQICRRADKEGRGIARMVQDLSSEVCDISGVDASSFLMFLGNISEEGKKLYTDYQFEDLQLALAAKEKWTNEWSKDVKQRYKQEMETLTAEAKAKGRKVLFMEVLGHIKVPIYEPTADLLRIAAPSSTFITNARSMAALGNAFLFGEKKLLSDTAIESLVSSPVTKLDTFMFCPTSFTKGGVSVFESAKHPAVLEGFYGWQGIGGSVFAFNLSKNISVAYVPNRYEHFADRGLMNSRFLSLIGPILKKI